MAETEYKVMFGGEVVPGADPAEVKANLAKLFGTSVDKVEPLFAGGRKMIKRGLSEPAALKYRAAFSKAGALAILVDDQGNELAAEPASAPAAEPVPAARPAPEAARPPPQPAPAPNAAAPAQQVAAAPSESDSGPADEPTRTELAEAGRAPPPLAARGLPTAPADMTMAEAGEVLVDSTGPASAPDIDTSHLSLSEPGVDLGERKAVPDAQYDLSEFDLAPPGALMSDDQ